MQDMLYGSGKVCGDGPGLGRNAGEQHCSGECMGIAWGGKGGWGVLPLPFSADR